MWFSGKNRFQLEVPLEALQRSTPDDYHLKSQKKGYKRFYTDYIEELIAEMVDAEERRDSALQDTLRNIFNKFDQKYVQVLPNKCYGLDNQGHLYESNCTISAMIKMRHFSEPMTFLKLDISNLKISIHF